MPNPLTCPKCSKQFKHESSRDRHVRICGVDSKRRFSCPYASCDKIFIRKEHVSRHEKSHNPLRDPKKRSATLIQKRRTCNECLRDKSNPDKHHPFCAECLHSERSDRALKYLVEELWDLYQFFHPQSFTSLCRATLRAKDNEKGNFEGILDALSSLGALYLDDEELSHRCYKSTLESLKMPGRAPIESFITYIILAVRNVVHNPPLEEGKTLIDIALRIARNIKLDYLDHLDTCEIIAYMKNNRISVLQWSGVNNRQLAEIFRDTWRRCWCHLMVADHDYSRIFEGTSLFRSKVSDLKIESPSVRLGDLYDLIHIESPAFRFPQDQDISEATQTLKECVELIKIRHIFVVGANHEAIRLYTELIASRSKSFKTNCDRLSVMYEYRYCQVLFLLLRLSITSWHNFDGKYLTAQDRHDNIAPAIRSMHLLREIKRDKTLNRWCSVKNADYKFNKDGIMQALVLYPTDEREYLVDAQKLFAEALSLN